MALATRCPSCHALFRVAADQLKLRGGLVRCGACRHIFDATGTLSYIDDATLSTQAQASAPAVGAVIAAIRKAESTASETLSIQGPATLPSAAVAAATESPSPAAEPAAASAAQVEPAATAGYPADTFAAADPDLPASAAQGDGTAEAALAAGPAPPQDQPAHEFRVDVEEPNAAAEPVEAAFLREGRAQRRRARTILFGSGALLLALLLLAQLAVAFRADVLVKFPQARPALEQLCKAFRCTVDWPARGDLLAVVGSELQALAGTSALELTAVVRNRGNMTLALPAIELTLSDTMNRTVARKVFLPSEYLAGESDREAHRLAGLEPGADLTVRIAFEARGLNAAGFVVYPFYL